MDPEYDSLIVIPMQVNDPFPEPKITISAVYLSYKYICHGAYMKST